MYLAYEMKLERTDFESDLGFDLFILQNVIEKNSYQQPQNELEIYNLNNYISFIQLIKDFCEQKSHKKEVHIHPMEAFSMFVRSIDTVDINSIEEVRMYAEKNLDMLNKIKQQRKLTNIESKNLMTLTSKISSQIKNDFFNDIQENKVEWRL